MSTLLYVLVPSLVVLAMWGNHANLAAFPIENVEKMCKPSPSLLQNSARFARTGLGQVAAPEIFRDGEIADLRVQRCQVFDLVQKPMDDASCVTIMFVSSHTQSAVACDSWLFLTNHRPLYGDHSPFQGDHSLTDCL